MTRSILVVGSIVLSALGIAFAQTATAGSGVTSVQDEKLIGSPPAPLGVQRQFQQDVKDVQFDFDRAELRPDDRTILAADADWLKSHPDVLITLEGDADERGDIVYNLVLSGNRAAVTRDALIELGVPADRVVFATGWGKLYPVCSQPDESCWSQNRRTHFSIWPPVDEGPQVASRVVDGQELDRVAIAGLH
jgi:peptidoglycan-associated lipoprotein